MALGLSSKLSKTGLITPGIVTSNLVLKHKYDAGSVIPVSDGAAYFDGTDDYIKLSSPITVTTNSATASICFWANRPEVTGSWRAILSAYDNAYTGESWILFGSTSASLYSESKTDSDVASATIDIQANKWHHYTITYDTGTVKMYVDGAEQTVSGDNASNDLEIELIGDDSTFFKGYVCNVGIWNGTQLTQAQIKSIMNKNYAGLTDSEKTNLVSWWNLDETIETTNISDEPNIVLDNNASNTEVLNWESNFSGTGITENADVGNFDVNANPPYTESYIDNDNKTVRLRAISDGPDEGDAVDHVQVKTASSLTVGKSYKIVVTVDSISGRFRIRPATGSSAADMTTTGVHTFYFHKSPSDYWRLERDFGAGDITVSDIKIYDIGNIGELS